MSASGVRQRAAGISERISAVAIRGYDDLASAPNRRMAAPSPRFCACVTTSRQAIVAASSSTRVLSNCHRPPARSGQTTPRQLLHTERAGGEESDVFRFIVTGDDNGQALGRSQEDPSLALPYQENAHDHGDATQSYQRDVLAQDNR
jgi:hypothetical protein